jgi:DNA-binding response OmpR family regulator
MPLPTVVIAQHDRSVARGLASELQEHFARVAVIRDTTELRAVLVRHEARVVVLDLDLVSLDEVQQLAGSAGKPTIVCTHHSPDEHMWMAALKAGADELCHSQDLRSILRASRTVAK